MIKQGKTVMRNFCNNIIHIFENNLSIKYDYFNDKFESHIKVIKFQKYKYILFIPPISKKKIFLIKNNNKNESLITNAKFMKFLRLIKTLFE